MKSWKFYKVSLLALMVLVMGLALGACGRGVYNAPSTGTQNQAPVSSGNTGNSGNPNPAAVGNGGPLVPAFNQTGQTLNPTGNLEVDIKNVVKAARPAGAVPFSQLSGPARA